MDNKNKMAEEQKPEVPLHIQFRNELEEIKKMYNREIDRTKYWQLRYSTARDKYYKLRNEVECESNDDSELLKEQLTETEYWKNAWKESNKRYEEEHNRSKYWIDAYAEQEKKISECEKRYEEEHESKKYWANIYAKLQQEKGRLDVQFMNLYDLHHGKK
jgi:hypothetical protein